ncbi:MAG: energy-coupling factor transporter transmembrane protein EcfT [Eubacteriales bacterium]|nr:energy-coupling factor transporter transmembrane protein EcfT [Eubacteriales bacterium]
MFENSNLGQYIPLDSFLHKLDPRIKLLALVAFIIVVIISRSPVGILALTGLAILCLLLSRIRWGEALRSMKPLLPLLILAFLINLLVTEAGDPLIFSWHFLKISQKSLTNAWVMTLRIASLIFVSNLFLSLTTTAMELSNGMTSLLSPLSRIGLPVQDMGMMMSIALRYIPSLMTETDNLMKAQSSRGANYDTGGLLLRLKGLVAVMVPLFISSFRQAEVLAEAMEARAYRSDIRRGKLHPLVLETKDYLFFLLFLALLVAIAVWDRILL